MGHGKKVDKLWGELVDTFVELAQWAVLLFLAVFVLGLTRQLGRFILPHEIDRPRLVPVQGPPVGARLSHTLSPQLLEALQAATAAKNGSRSLTALVVVRDRCASCGVLLDALAGSSPPPVVALVTEPAEREYLEHVEAVVREVVTDPDGQLAKDLLIVTTPFVLLLGPEFELLHKQQGGTVASAIQELDDRLAAIAQEEAERLALASPARAHLEVQHAFPLEGGHDVTV